MITVWAVTIGTLVGVMIVGAFCAWRLGGVENAIDRLKDK